MKTLYFSIFFLLYFLCLFLWYPLNHTLPGLSDTIYNITIFNDYWNRLAGLISGEATGHAGYPGKMMQLYVEPYFGQAAIFLVAKFIFRNDVISYYIFLSVLYAFSALGSFYFFRYFFRDYLVSGVLGLCFATSSFMISQMELLNGIAWFPFFIALTLFLYYQEIRKRKLLLLAAIFSGVQIYFSPYITVYLAIILMCLVTFDVIRQPKRVDFTGLSLSAALGLCLIFPYVYIVLVESVGGSVYNHFTVDLIGNFSFQAADFFRSLPHNAFYNEEGWLSSKYSSEVIKNNNSGFIGIAVYATALMGVFQKNRTIRIAGILFLLLGFILSVGPVLHMGQSAIPMPMYPIYKYTVAADFLRVPARAFSLFVIGVLLLSGLFWSQWQYDKKKWMVGLFGLVFIFENIPLHDDYHEFLSTQITEPKSHVLFLKEQPDLVNIAHLPSSLFSGKKYSNQMLSEYNREYLYAYWQTKHKQNVVNGPCHFCPEFRIYNNQLLMFAGDSASLNKLIHLNQLDYILYHDELALDKAELDIKNNLLRSSLLELVAKKDSVLIFKTL